MATHMDSYEWQGLELALGSFYSDSRSFTLTVEESWFKKRRRLCTSECHWGRDRAYRKNEISETSQSCELSFPVLRLSIPFLPHNRVECGQLALVSFPRGACPYGRLDSLSALYIMSRIVGHCALYQSTIHRAYSPPFFQLSQHGAYLVSNNARILWEKQLPHG